MATSNIDMGVPNLVRIKEAAGRFGVSVRTLYRVIAEGGLTVVHVRGCACIEETELREYVERNKQRRRND